MAKEKDKKTAPPKKEKNLTEIRKAIVLKHLGEDKLNTLDFENAIVLTKPTFERERYNIEFFKMIKAKSPIRPLIIVADGEGETASIIQIGYFDALEAGLWYNIIPLHADELAQI